MNRVARFWLLLTVSYAVAHGLVFALVWRTIDLRIEIAAQHAAIPLLQGIVLAWLAGAFRWRPVAWAVKQAVRRPLISALWCIQGALLLASSSSPFGRILSGLIPRIAALEAILAAVLILLVLIPSRRNRVRTTMIPFALLLLILGSNGVKPWLNALPGWLPDGWPFLLKQALILSCLLVGLILITDMARNALAPQFPLARVFLGGLYALYMAVALSLVMNGYLYAFLTQPWLHIITWSLFLGAACALTSALCLFPPQYPGPSITRSARQIRRSPMGFFGLWFILALCALTAALLLRILLFRHWDCGAKTWLSLGLVPLVQASWFRWARAMGIGWKRVPELIRSRPLFSVLLSLEVITFGYMALARDLWEQPLFATAVSFWVSLKLAILGAIILMRAFRDTQQRAFRGFCGAVASICGVAVAFPGGFSETTWIMPAFGAASALLAVGWSSGPGTTVRIAGGTAEACITPILVMGFCLLWTPDPPLVPLYPVALTMVALSTTLSAMGFREKETVRSIPARGGGEGKTAGPDPQKRSTRQWV